MNTNRNEHHFDFIPVLRSLADFLGPSYLRSVVEARGFLDGSPDVSPERTAGEQVDFYPAALQRRWTALLDSVGRQVIEHPLGETAPGAGSASFHQATNTRAAPLSAGGYYRVGEDGRLYLVTKSEHYHAPLGHGFPGYRLTEKARALGIPNATHNNTRGTITRTLERELIRTANGLPRGDEERLRSVLERKYDLQVLNRVLNLETGSLAVEAALKMVLARFHPVEQDMAAPKYHGRIPVILVMGNDDGGLQANYHGTTVLTQMMRGMWPELHDRLEEAAVWKIVPIRPNSIEDLEQAFAVYETGPWKIAGFFHEIVMMNYGGRRLTPEFLCHAHALCDRHDVPTVVDEIQSCMWSPRLYLFREYRLNPTFVAIGKGFPGGEFPASRLLFSSAMDSLPQFGALVTNGQEELASLSYLITMEWVTANAEPVAALGAYYHAGLRELAEAYPHELEGVDGWNHMTTLRFRGLDPAKAFAAALGGRGLDVSAQTYKADCPPVVLTKLPLIADRPMIDWVLERMNEAMEVVGTPTP